MSPKPTVNDNRVALSNTLVAQNMRKLVDEPGHVGVSNPFPRVGIGRVPNQSDAVASALIDVALEAVVGRVHLAAFEPFPLEVKKNEVT